MKIIKKHFASLGSTNDYLLEQIVKENELWVCVADQQTKGRGRNDKVWHSPPGGNLYISFAWLTRDIRKYLADFSVEIGLLCKNVLEQIIEQDDLIRIKLPNDLYVADRKLGGILVETKIGSNYQAKIVVGIGINITTSVESYDQITVSCALKNMGIFLDREELIALLINEFIKQEN